ncbi:hypothetical protein [Raoultella ornithinolytica]|uniref:Uncharacterized protein n=1 Tax=Raoultella ornithinolytica TaxID=54291 RepID=A0A9Q9JF02_RAOOR|nr:hypothetical protein [Raoultella ornithinolytica]UXE39466.1 hypothetical protein N2J37_06865 [Raoultella ornithinolytica]
MSELTAALATIEKCREISGCPAGVDLQDWVKRLAAENVGLKKFIKTDCFVGHIEPETFYEEEVTRYVSADGFEPEPPATDRIYAGIKADVLPADIAEIIDSGDLETICYESERSYAEDFRIALYSFRQLREGAK